MRGATKLERTVFIASAWEDCVLRMLATGCSPLSLNVCGVGDGGVGGLGLGVWVLICEEETTGYLLLKCR